MGNEVLISVIMAVYNGEKYLRHSLDTIINQTFKNIEIICVDDGSTDRSLDILNEYKSHDDRIRILLHKEKTDGAAAARNMGLREAVGEYVSFLDADDFFELEMLEKAYNKAKIDDSDIVLFDAYVYDNITKRNFEESWILNHSVIPNKESFSPLEAKNHLFRIGMGAAWNSIFRRKFVIAENLWFESINHTDDQVFVYMAYCCAKKISIIDERFVHYRKNTSGSQSANVSKHPEAAYMAPYVLKKKLIEKGLYTMYKEALAELSIEVAHWHLDQMTDWGTFSKLYHKLKDYYFEELGINEATVDMVEKNEIRWRDLVLSCSPQEYLLKKNAITQDMYLENIPNNIKEGSKVVIYGAGIFGKELFSRIFRAGIFKVVGWVDRNYAHIGFPIMAVEKILEMEFDFIFVAIKKDNIFISIKKTLLDMGIDEDRIIWINTL